MKIATLKSCMCVRAFLLSTYKTLPTYIALSIYIQSQKINLLHGTTLNLVFIVGLLFKEPERECVYVCERECVRRRKLESFVTPAHNARSMAERQSYT